MLDERRFTRLVAGSLHVRHELGDDVAIGALAERQHGVVARRQLLDIGISHDAIDHRLRGGRLLRVFAGHRSAYAVGHLALSLAGRAVAAVIVVGPGAVASHWTVASLRGLIRHERPLVHVTSPHAHRRPHGGLVIHRAVLPDVDTEIVDGVPVTTLSRLALDLSAETDERELRALLKRAEYRGLLQAPEIVAILERYPRRRGRRTLARIARGYAFGAGRTASPLEDDFLEFCGRRGLPMPETNAPIWAGGRWRTVDCVWREARLVLELDGRDAHARELAFEDDRERDRALTVAGWRPIRVTSAQLGAGADALERDLRAALGLDERRFTRHPPG